jgi:hypothetical protein
MRNEGIGKLAVIAATGTGKTYLAAFDFQQSGFERILFVAHRENILQRARESFGKVMQEADFGSILGGGNGRTQDGRAVFAMVQTLGRKKNLRDFSPDAFDYIVIDEFHHGMADSYRRIIDYFQPRLFLGLTATPERMDDRDVLARVSARLKSMPLHFLGNTDKDFFILDKKADIFRLKDGYIPFWRDETFRKLLRELVEFTLVRYFQQRPKLFSDR